MEGRIDLFDEASRLGSTGMLACLHKPGNSMQLIFAKSILQSHYALSRVYSEGDRENWRRMAVVKEKRRQKAELTKQETCIALELEHNCDGA
jgi:hypothetical protein